MSRQEKVLTHAIVWTVVLGILLSVAVVWSVGLGDIIEAFHRASWTLIGLYVAVSLLIAILLTMKWAIVLDAYGVRLPFATLFIYRLIGYAVSYVTPTAHVGGEPVRAMLLGKQGIPMKVGFSSAVVDRSLELVFNMLMFFIGGLILLNLTEFPRPARIAILIFSIVAVGIVGLFVWGVVGKKRFLVPGMKLLRLNRLKSWKTIERWVDEVELLIQHFYAKKKGHFRLAVFINSLLWVLMLLEYKFALLLLGYDASVLGAFLFLTGVGIAYSLPIPAGLGVLELGQLGAASVLGVAPAIAIALAFLIRFRDLVWTFLGLILLWLFHFNLFRLFEKSEAAAKKYNFETVWLEVEYLRSLRWTRPRGQKR